MSWWFYLLAAAPAVIWGFSPIVSKRALSDGGNHIQGSFVLVMVCGLIYWSVLLITSDPTTLFDSFSLPLVAIFFCGGVVGTAIGRLCAFAGVDRVGASLASIAISSRPLFSGILAVALLGETVTWVSGTGIVLVVAGLMLISRTRGGDRSGWRAVELLIPLMAAVAFGAGNVIRRWGLTVYEVSSLEAVALNEVGALLAMGIYFTVSDHKIWNGATVKNTGLFVCHGCLTAVALLAMFEALRLGPVVVVDPLSSLAPLFTAVFTALFLKDLEKITLDILLGALIVVIGVGLITGGWKFILFIT